MVSSSFRSGISGFIVGSFLGGNTGHAGEHAPAPSDASETTSLLSHSDAAENDSRWACGPQTAAPAMSSLGNSMEYGSLLPAGGLSENMHAEAPREPVPPQPPSDKEVHQWRERELRALVRFTLPIWATHLLELSLSIVSVLSLGHLGTVELAASSMAGMAANVTGFSVISGLVCALDTLLPASYTRNPRMMGIWTQRVGIIVAAVMPFIIALWCNADKLLLLVVKNPEIAHKARDFLTMLSIGLPGHAIFELCRRFLQVRCDSEML